MENLSNLALITFGVISSLTGYLFFSYSKELNSALTTLKDLDSITHILNPNEKIIASGIISCNTQPKPVTPTQSLYSGNEFALQIVSKDVFNRFMVKLRNISDFGAVNEFIIGEKSKIPVKVLNKTIVTGTVKFEKVKINDFGWDLGLKSFGKFFEYFTRTREILIPDKSLVYVEGIVGMDGMGRNVIVAEEVAITPNRLFSGLRTKKSMAFKLFALAAVAFIVTIICKRALMPEKKDFQGPVKCVKCKNPASIVLKPCFHFNLCRKCLFSTNSCPICNQWITTYATVTL